MVGGRLRFRSLMRLLWYFRGMNSWAEIKNLLKIRPILVGRKIKKSANPVPPTLFEMASSYWASQAIYVAAKLGIADLLAEGPKSSIELSSSTGTDARSLFRLMRALANLDILSHTGSDYFALSSLGEALQSNVPGSLRAMIISLGEIHYQAWGSLLHSVQTGSSGFRHALGIDLFPYLQAQAPASDSFNQGMTNLSAMLSYAVLCAYDFSNISHLIDIGGGQGTFLRNISQFYPKLKATVLDVPSTIETAKRLNNGSSGKVLSFVSGDFFRAVPSGADAHLLSGVIHDWNDDRAVIILRNCRNAIERSGTLLLVEMVVPEDGASCFSKLLDLNMLVMNEGRERTRSEFCSLLAAAGYKLTKVVPTLAPQSVIEAIPV